MAIVLKFKQGDSGTELNLNAGATGFQLAGQGWNPSVATPVYMGDPPPIGETIHLLLKHTSQDNIAASMQSLHEMQVLADRYINDPAQESPVWLHAKMASETGERRALIYSITAQYKTSWFGEPATALDIPLVLSVVRSPYWENTTVRNLPDATPAAGACVVYDYTAAGDAVGAHDIVGDVGARLRLFVINDNGVDEVNRFWMGLRSVNKHGANSITNFINVWECEDGTNLDAGDVADAADATASGGNRVTVTEVGTDWDDGSFHDVLYLHLDDVTANLGDQLGDFLWLLRSKVTAGTWEVKLSFAYGETTVDAQRIKSDILEISSTSWLFKEVTTMPISLRNTHAITTTDIATTLEDVYSIKIQARRTSGAGDLYLDCLVPIPIDEGFAKMEYAASGATSLNFNFGESPEGMAQAISGTATYLFRPGALESLEHFRLPLGDGRIYCVYERTASSDITDTIIFNNGDAGRYYERWLSLRGSE